jgi:hypothetical protein
MVWPLQLRHQTGAPMALSLWVTTATLLAVINVVILLALGGVWVSNYRQFRSTLVLGLVSFSAILFIENLAAIYSFFEWGSLYADSDFAKQFVTGLRALQVLALGMMAYVTWQ